MLTDRDDRPFRPPSPLERIVCALTPPRFGALDNRLDTEAFREGRRWMIGDRVEVRLWPGRRRPGEIVQLHNKEAIGRRVEDRFFTIAARVRWEARGDRYVVPSRIRLVERSRCYRELFLARYPLGELPCVDSGRDLDRDLQESSVPGSNLGRELEAALIVLGLYGDPERASAILEGLLRRASIVERGLANRSDWRRPRTRAEAMISRVLAAAVLGEPLDEADLRQASDLLVEHCAEISPGYWDALGKGDYLLAVMCVLLAGDESRARELLKSRRSFRGVEDLRRILLRRVRPRASSASDDRRDADDCFDFHRHPYGSFHRDGTSWLLLPVLSALQAARDARPGRTLDGPRVAAQLYA